MADAALFEFLHTEMVAELWAHHSDPGPGVSAGPRGVGGGDAGRGGKGGSRPWGAPRAGQRPGSSPAPALLGAGSLLREVSEAAAAKAYLKA